MDDDQDIDIDPEMAAAMGFSSFGGVTKPKKRKYNDNDAFVDPSTSFSATVKPGKGANATELGIRKQAAKVEGSERDSRTYESLNESMPARQGLPASPDNPSSSREASGVLKGGDLPGLPLPSPSISTATSVTLGDGPMKPSAADLHALANGVRLPNGDMMYYLPSFTENPWARLE